MLKRVILLGSLGLVSFVLIACESVADSSIDSPPGEVVLAAGGEDTQPGQEPCALEQTPSNAEGPFYKAGAPERTSLIEPGIVGTRLQLTGTVMTVSCEPVPGALLDFWQTDGNGEYDNDGFRMRGKLFANEQGDYRLDTTLPGLYPGRPAHIHVKVTPPGGPELTTQIYFPGAEFGNADSLVRPALIASLEKDPQGEYVAIFDFVLAP